VVEWESADPGAERDQCQRAATELVGLSQSAPGGPVMISAEVGPPSSIVAAWIT
jgi:hypothetical protein